jgi:membrane protease YdiL (CAAX protease family)
MRSKKQESSQLILAIFGFMVFCGLSLLSQAVYPLFGLVTLIGIAFPLIWGKFIGTWVEIGFSKQKIRSALLWGIIGGILTSLIGVAVLPKLFIPSRLGLQLAIGVPIWALIASPFQELFFRGWLQTRFENRLGNWWGLLLANTCFTLWHYTAPFVSTTTVPLRSPIGALATFGAGLVYAYVFQRTHNIIAPWLAHLLSGITFIVVGAMDFTQPPI